MSRTVIILNGPSEKQAACDHIRRAPAGSRVEIKSSSRSIEQNRRLWSALSDIARQVEWYGRKLTAENWKDICTASLRHYQVVPGLEEGTLVPLGMSTRQMTWQEFNDLLTLIYAFGAERGVKFTKREGELVDG